MFSTDCGENMTKFKIKYRRSYFTVEGEKLDYCECCGKKPDPRGLHRHHWAYTYKTSEVRENPQLALENTSTLCFVCHRVADALRAVKENPEKVKKLEKLRKEAIK